MRIACWIPTATNTNSEYIILISCPFRQWLHNRTMLHYTYIACLDERWQRSGQNSNITLNQMECCTFSFTKEINWLMGKKSHLSIENKLLIYKAVIKPIWSYGIELCGCASKSNKVIMQRSQSKILRATTNAPRYVTNHILHTDFNIPYVSDVTNERTNKHHNKPEAHPNPLL